MDVFVVATAVINDNRLVNKCPMNGICFKYFAKQRNDANLHLCELKP